MCCVTLCPRSFRVISFISPSSKSISDRREKEVKGLAPRAYFVVYTRSIEVFPERYLM